ncbi:MAG: hypothetical protein ACRD0K_12165 [Egibacteraceae bacterium]
MSRQGALGLGPFLDTLERRLGELSAQELRRALLDRATRLPAAERAGFLAVFDRPAGVHSDGGAGQPTLLDEIAAFLADVEAGAYVEGWGYDPDYGDHRAFGDETWTMDMARLLDQAGHAFLTGDVALARQAYERLLTALTLEYDEGGFPGAGTPQELLGRDVDEAKHRCLRAVWEAEPVTDRAAAFVEAASGLAHVGGHPSLAAVEATRREPLPGLDAVLGDLIARLGAVDATRYGFAGQALRLLAEATERHRGVDGLGELAHTPGDGQPEASRDWVDGLVRAGRLADAEEAARQMLELLEPHGPVQATIAERLGALAAVRGDGPAMLRARQAAWGADPTLERLLDLVDAAIALGRRDEVLAAEADRAGEGPLAKRTELAAGVLLLAGRVDDAVALLAQASPLGWSHSCHPGPVVVPFLLVGGSGAACPEGSLLHELLEGVNAAGWLRYDFGRDEGVDAFRAALRGAGGVPRSPLGVPRADLSLSGLLVDTIERRAPGSDERARWLDAARVHVEARVDAVVGGKHRGAYQRVARLAAACAEALALTSGASAGQRLIDDVHARYPLHSAFRGQLRSAFAASPLLAPTPARPH